MKKYLVGSFEFLYRIVTSPMQNDGDGDPTEIRLAMTHAHVALVLADAVDPRVPLGLARELAVASGGLRRRVPVLVVVPGGVLPAGGELAHAADRVVGFEATAIASGVQDLAEAAVRRARQAVTAELEEFAGWMPRVHPSLPAAHDMPRPLPVAEIARAFAEHRQAPRR